MPKVRKPGLAGSGTPLQSPITVARTYTGSRRNPFRRRSSGAEPGDGCRRPQDPDTDVGRVNRTKDEDGESHHSHTSQCHRSLGASGRRSRLRHPRSLVGSRRTTGILSKNRNYGNIPRSSKTPRAAQRRYIPSYALSPIGRTTSQQWKKEKILTSSSRITLPAVSATR